MEEEFSSVQSETASLTNKVDNLEDMVDCLKLMMKFVMGSCSGESTQFPIQ